MKTRIQNNPNRNTAMALFATGLILSVLSLDVRGGNPSPYTAMSVLFDDLDGDRMKSDGALYSDFEPDVSAGSTGGFAVRTEVTTGLRKLWLDLDDDGLPDVVLHFSASQLVDGGALNANTTELLLTGCTTAGQSIFGKDQVRIVGGGN